MTSTPTTTMTPNMIDLKLIVKDAETKKPLSNARINLYFDGNLVYNTTKVDSNGTITMKIHQNGFYNGNVTKAGYDENNFELEVDCSKDECFVKRFILMSLISAPDKTRIMLTWDEFPLDLDLHVMAVRISDNKTCRTYPEDHTSCEDIAAVQGDGDITNGGDEGETITLTNSTVNKDFTYVIGMEDFNFDNSSGTEFENSNAIITLTNGLKTEYDTMPFNETLSFTSK